MPVLIVEAEEQLVFWSQLTNSLLEPCKAFVSSVVQQFVGSMVRQFLHLNFHFCPPLSRLMSKTFQRRVISDTQQPRSETRPFRIETVQTLEGAHQGILCHFFCIFWYVMA